MKRYSFGADIGGTTVKLGFFDGDRLEGAYEIPTITDNGGERILPDIAAKIDEILKERSI